MLEERVNGEAVGAAGAGGDPVAGPAGGAEPEAVGAGGIEEGPGAAVDNGRPEVVDVGGEDEPFYSEEQLKEPRVVAGRRRGSARQLVKPAEAGEVKGLKPEQRLLLLDTWQRSGLPAGDFADLVGVVSKQTLYQWKKRFEELGPAGLMDGPRGPRKSGGLPEATKRAILMMKEANPEWGVQRISDMLLRGPALPASPGAVGRVLHEAGYQLEEVPTKPHPDKVRSFERAKPNQLWQTDLFTFILKRQNRRVYLVAFMDDHSRFITGYGLHGSQSTALVLEVLRAALTAYGQPEEILTDNGAQYVTWRGKSAFSKELDKRGIRQVVASPRHPQTLGKTERFWGTLWKECLEAAVFIDLEDARRRIGLFIDHYNFQRPHQGIGSLTPAERFFQAAPEVLKTLKERAAGNSLELARNGIPREPFYMTGRVGGQAFSVHSEGERVILTQEGQGRKEVELSAPKTGAESVKAQLPAPVAPDGSPIVILPGGGEPPAPGTSPLDEDLKKLAAEGLVK